MKSAVMSLAVLLFCFISFSYSYDYTIEVTEDMPTNTLFVQKDSATSRYTGSVIVYDVGDGLCAWTFCITRSFRGIITEHFDLNGVRACGENPLGPRRLLGGQRIECDRTGGKRWLVVAT